MPREGLKNEEHFCFVFNKYQGVTHFYMHFWRAFQNYFFIDRTFHPLPYPMNLKKNIFFLTKNPLNYYSLKVTQCHGDSVKNEC